MATSPVTQKGEFLSFFLFQCERITLPNSRRRLRPPRTILSHIASIEPFLFSYLDPTTQPSKEPAAVSSSVTVRVPPAVTTTQEDEEDGELVLLSTMPPSQQEANDNNGDVLDLSTFYPGSYLCTALFRALELFQPKAAAPPSQHMRLVLNVVELNISQCGLDNESIDALCRLLGSGRCVHLEAVLLDRNEYVAVEAGQMLLRMLGVRGALGDGARGKSHRIGTGNHNASAAVSAGAAAPVTSAPTQQAAAATDGTLASCDTTTLEGVLLPLSESLPSLQCLSLVGTNVPPHYIRRLEGLVRDIHNVDASS
ncbi:Hypothetical protein, putative [Bodo saltans]|uniref:Uncharacterized protein n=1 Tax=Bodo saltans TaxID=75058 RepID=A0A0S4IQ16_BODSA|nr:Hypothetical protein, putative [Bodo saltans]|eukprot:CUF19869.1 Hypothetical protein, putative [Bodo saltans]